MDKSPNKFSATSQGLLKVRTACGSVQKWKNKAVISRDNKQTNKVTGTGVDWLGNWASETNESGVLQVNLTHLVHCRCARPQFPTAGGRKQ